MLVAAVSTAAEPLSYPGGDGIGKGKHIVFIASDHEYRAEEICPALARILSKHHGFKTTVVLGVDDDGNLKAGSSNIPGTSALETADLMVIAARFLNPAADQMEPIVAYLERGGPVAGLRTSTHAFKIPKDSPFAKYDFKSEVEGYEKGFGHQVLGNTWVGHYGRNHRQMTRNMVVPEKKDHPILRGVNAIMHNHAGGYVGEPTQEFDVLTKTIPLLEFREDAEPDPSKVPQASTWTRHYTSKSGTKARVFHSTQGASQDILDESYRRMIVNGILWTLSMEDTITADLEIGFVGPYQPSKFSFGGEVRNVKPLDLAGFDSPIMPQGPKHTPKPRERKKKPARKKPADKKKEAAAS